MKKLIATLVLISVAAVAGTIVYLNWQKPLPAPAPQQAEAEPALPEKIAAPMPQQPRLVSDKSNEPAPITTSSANDVKPVAASTLHSRAVDTLVSAQTSFSDRHVLLKQLKKTGELDAAVAELKLRASENPNEAMIQTALGEAIMGKFPIQNYNEAALLGLQIDQSFNAALALDPANWEAQFSKAVALAGWPPQMNTGPEVIQRLSSLIDQQETMPSQPQFAQTYALLGDQYKKAGKADYAQTTWQLGLAKFPNDPALQKKISNP